jgi:outer membrane lipoprotein-sorting protein
MSDNNSLNPEELLNRAIAGLRQQEVPEKPNTEFAFPPYRSSSSRPAKVSTRLRSIIMSRIFKIATFVTIAFLAAMGIVWFILLSASSSPPFAFADVQKAAAEVHTVSYRVQVFMDDKAAQSFKITSIEPDLLRDEAPDGHVIIMNLKTSRSLCIIPDIRKVEIRPLYPSTSAKRTFADWLATLRNIPAQSTGKGIEMVVDGRKAIEFSFKESTYEFLALVDRDKMLPLRMEMDLGVQPISGVHVRHVYTDFIFDEQIEESLFNPTPPEGFEVIQYESQPAVAGDKSLVLIAGVGIGPVKFGMTAKQVVELIGTPDHIDKIEGSVLPLPVNPANSKELPKGMKRLDEKALRDLINGRDLIKSGKKETIEEVLKGSRVVMTLDDLDKAELSKLPKKVIKEKLIYDSRGFEITVDCQEGVMAIICKSQAELGPTVRDFQGMTKDGITVGNSWDDVLKAYGEPDEKIDKCILFYIRLGWEFRFQTSKLSSIHLTKPSADQEKEIIPMGKSNKVIKRVKRP